MREARKVKRKYRLLVADHGGVFRLGLKKLFAVEDDFRVVAQAESAAQVAGLAKKFKAELLLVQDEIADEGPGDSLARIRQAVPEVRILILVSAVSDSGAQDYLKRGASGVLLKSADPSNFVKCAEKALQNQVWLPTTLAAEASLGGAKQLLRPVDTLTRREKSIIGCLLQGWRNREIARHLSITEQTVKNHLRTIFDKVGVSDRLELVLYAIHHRLEIPPLSPATSP